MKDDGSDYDAALALLNPDWYPEPDRIPGEREQTLSPMDALALPSYGREPVMASADFGLTQRKITKIRKGGIELHGRSYSHERLIEYTADSDDEPLRELVLRYDRARAARGTLKEVSVYEVLPGGEYHLVCIARPRSELRDPIRRAQFLEYRRQYVRSLKALVGASEHEFLTLKGQETKIRASGDEWLAANRRKQSSRSDREPSAQPISAAPRSEDDKQAQEALSRESAGGPGKSRKADQQVRQHAETEDEFEDRFGAALGGESGMED